jgi:hypothetical protein
LLLQLAATLQNDPRLSVEETKEAKIPTNTEAIAPDNAGETVTIPNELKTGRTSEPTTATEFSSGANLISLSNTMETTTTSSNFNPSTAASPDSPATTFSSGTGGLATNKSSTPLGYLNILFYDFYGTNSRNLMLFA